MFLLKYLFFVPFFCPNPNQPSFMWDWNVLDAKWQIFLYALIILYGLAFCWYYFLSKPNPSAVRKFFVMILILLLLSGFGGYIYLYQFRNILFIEPSHWTFDHTIASFLSGMFCGFELSIIFLIVFLLISQIPLPWQLRAMRKYPIKQIP